MNSLSQDTGYVHDEYDPSAREWYDGAYIESASYREPRVLYEEPPRVPYRHNTKPYRHGQPVVGGQAPYLPHVLARESFQDDTEPAAVADSEARGPR